MPQSVQGPAFRRRADAKPLIWLSQPSVPRRVMMAVLRGERLSFLREDDLVQRREAPDALLRRKRAVQAHSSP